MSIISKWKNYKESQSTRRISKNLKTIQNSKAIKEDRVGAIEFFKEYQDVTTSVPALLSRFEFSLEHGINDTREKESCLDGILKFGADALPLVKEHIKETNRIAWPIKALTKLGNDEQAVEALKECLNFDDISFDQAKLDKNYDILCYLVDYQLGSFTDKIVAFLEVHDERIRFATVELLLEQDNANVPSYLEKFLWDSSAENTRLCQAVTHKFSEKQWKLVNLDANTQTQLLSGYYLDNSTNTIKQR